MTPAPPLLGEWLLRRLGAPDELVGDLCELAGCRGRCWYWGQVFAVACFSAAGSIRRHPWRIAWGVGTSALVLIALGHVADLHRQPPSEQVLRLEVISTGWRVVAASDHRVNVVPAARVRVVNLSQGPVTGVQVNAVFRRVADGIEWGNHWQPVSRGTGLAPGATSESVLVTSETGHVSTSPVRATLRHPSFVDATLEVYGRYGAQAWAKLGDYRVPRQVVEP